MTDVDEAWIAFKNKGEHIAKASVAEKLDVIAAQLNEIQTDTKRTAEIVPKIMGDETAIDEANASADMGGMPPMEGDMGGAPPEDMGAEGEEMTGEELPPEDAMGAEEGAEEMPPAEGEAPMPEEAPGTDAVAEGEPAVEEDEGAEDLIGDVEDEEFEDLDEDDSDVIESLKDALQEALDNDQMGLVSKIANAINMLQGSTQGGSDILSGAEETADIAEEGVPEEGLPVGEDGLEGAVEETEAPEEGAPEAEEEKTEEVEKSVGAGDPSPDMTAEPGQIAASPDGATKKEASGTEEVKEKVMEAVAEGLDEALGIESEEEEDEEEEESETEEKNEAIADNPFEECNSQYTMKSALKKASSMSFKDLVMMKKSKQFGIDGRLAKSADATPSALDDQMPYIAENAVEDEEVEEDVEEIPLEDVESAKDVAEAPEALEPGVRTEVEETVVEEGPVKEYAEDTLDEVGEPLNKSATLDEVGCAKEILKEGKSTDHGDLLDDVDEKKEASGSAEPKPTVADEVGDADKSTNKGEEAKSMLDDLDAKKGEGSAENPDDLLDQVGHEKKATEHTVKPGTGLLDDVKVAKSAQDNGKHIMSLKEMMSVRKSAQRPDSITSTSGDITRPELGQVKKSANVPSPRMGRGVDPHKVTENDWAEYNLYMAQKR